MKNYVLPDKSILCDKIEDNSNKYYSLSKMILKRDIDKKLLIPFGIDRDGKKIYQDLKDVSSLLVCGETGSGKSMFLDCLIISLLLKNSPDDLEFLFIDPKKIELNSYKGLPHLVRDIVSDIDISLMILRQVIDDRIELINNSNCMDIVEYNNKFEDKIKDLVIVIDESSLIIDNPDMKLIISSIIDVGSKMGIHLILSTNSCLKETFDSNLLKGFSYKLSFDLASGEQAMYMDMFGSEFLTVYGEAIIKDNMGKFNRVQVPYVMDSDIDRVVSFWKSQI